MEEYLQFFEKLLSPKRVIIDKIQKEPYGSDYTENLFFEPAIVLLPETTEEVSAIMAYCNINNITVTPRGAGTGLSGACLPVMGGVVLSTERMNSIIDVDVENFQATLQPGVINEVFRQKVAEHGLFYPPDPASKGSCFMGGNVLHNSGGPKAVKYGVTRDYILNLQIVLCDGTVMWTGSDTLKNSTGYSLTHLIIGSEGTLAIVTRIVVRLITLPTCDYLLLASFKDAVSACGAVSPVFRAGVVPSAMEFMERSAVEISCRYLNEAFDFEEDAHAYLLVEVDGFEAEKLMDDCETIATILEENGALNVLFADNAQQKEKLWKIRRAIGEKVKAHSVYKEEDTVVKRAHLPQLLDGVKQLGERYGFESICYGHAGDGNLHVNIIKGKMTDDAWHGEDLKKGIREIFRLCKKLGGTISGEHGIGLVQKEFMDEIFSKRALQLMADIKKAFDPKGILNPQKIIPELV